LVDITKDLKDMKAIRIKQKKEYDRLKENVSQLQTHQKYLQEKVDDFEKYIKDSTKKQFQNKDTKKDTNKGAKKFKFTYKQLKQKGVISSVNVMKSQVNSITFIISMPEPGEFNVDAKVAGLTVKTISILLDDLLQKKSKGIQTLDYEYVVLDVNMTLFTLNKLFIQ